MRQSWRSCKRIAFLLRRHEPISIVSTVSAKLVDLLATTFSGDLMDPVTSWEHNAKETRSDLIKIEVVIKGLDKTSFVDRHCLHDRVDEICETDRKR